MGGSGRDASTSRRGALDRSCYTTLAFCVGCRATGRLPYSSGRRRAPGAKLRQSPAHRCGYLGQQRRRRRTQSGNGPSAAAPSADCLDQPATQSGPHDSRRERCRGRQRHAAEPVSHGVRVQGRQSGRRCSSSQAPRHGESNAGLFRGVGDSVGGGAPLYGCGSCVRCQGRDSQCERCACALWTTGPDWQASAGRQEHA